MYSWYGTYLLLEMFEWADVNMCLGFTCAAHNLRKKTAQNKHHRNKDTTIK